MPTAATIAEPPLELTLVVEPDPTPQPPAPLPAAVDDRAALLAAVAVAVGTTVFACLTWVAP